MKKLIRISILLVFVLSAFPLKAQNVDLQQYWDDVDFGDSTLVASQMMSDKLVAFFYSFTDGDERCFDSLSIEGLGVVLDRPRST